MGLSLYQQLCNLARMALGAGDARDSAHPHTRAMDHLWKIALRANSTGQCGTRGSARREPPPPPAR